MPHRAIPPRNRSNARSLRSTMTEAEKRIWFHLRAHRLNGASFRRQTPVGAYIIDFVCFDARLIVEIDGGQHADSQSDKAREIWLRSQGFVVLRFWNNDVLANTSGVLERINEALSASSPPSLALPRKGGGNPALPEAR
jgi:very-short-patch-repair endonuclease